MTKHSVRWILPTVNARRASLRYRCLYPMRTLGERGYDVGVWNTREPFASKTTIAVDAWTLFPTQGVISLDILSVMQRARDAGCRIILDNCDNQFAAVTQTAEWKAGLDSLCKAAALATEIVCCSDMLVKNIKYHVTSSAKYSVIEDPVEDKIWYPGDVWWRSLLSLNRKASWLKALRHAATVLGDRRCGRTPLVWFGSHGNGFAPGGMTDLASKKDMLETLNRTVPLSLSIISNSQHKFDQIFRDWCFPVRYLPWDRETFIFVLGRHEISLIPSLHNAFTECKSSNRLVHSLSRGLAVMADPVPSYLKLAEHVRIGDWNRQLRDLIQNPQQRRDQVSAGQAFVREEYSLEAIATKWAAVFFKTV